MVSVTQAFSIDLTGQVCTESVDGVLVPGGFGSRGWEGKILACRVARERRIPYLGICLGMQIAVIEFARNVCGLEGADSTEVDENAPGRPARIEAAHNLDHQLRAAGIAGATVIDALTGTIPVTPGDIPEVLKEAVIAAEDRNFYGHSGVDLGDQPLQAALDKDGQVNGWTHCVVGDGGVLLQTGIRIHYYQVPNQHIESRGVSHGMRLKHWRAVGHVFNVYAIESFIDEMAAAEGMDPIDFRLQRMSITPRARALFEKVAQMSDWKAPRQAEVPA